MPRTIAIALLSLALLSAGCAPTPPAEPPARTPGPTTTPTAPTTSTAPGVANEPGIHELPDGRVRVVGTLMTSDLEGGFVGVQLQRPIDSFSATTVVIANAADLPDVARAQREGWGFVAVTGRLLDGVSIRQAGPELQAEAIERLE